jgi:hypothetical protein
MSRSATPLQRTIKAVVRSGNESGYVAERVETAEVTQRETLVTANLREAVSLHLDGEDLAALGLAPNSTLAITMELEPAYASAPRVCCRHLSLHCPPGQPLPHGG